MSCWEKKNDEAFMPGKCRVCSPEKDSKGSDELLDHLESAAEPWQLVWARSDQDDSAMHTSSTLFTSEPQNPENGLDGLLWSCCLIKKIFLKIVYISTTYNISTCFLSPISPMSPPIPLKLIISSMFNL